MNPHASPGLGRDTLGRTSPIHAHRGILARIVGEDAVRLIRREPDPAIAAIVGNWARGFEPARATSLGFTAERSFDEIVQVYLEDDAAAYPG